MTIFTPAYNRASTLEQLYRSLQRQTCHDFEWLVVDDGSSDHTAELFAAWGQEENPFPIRYFQKGNGGKHTAINEGVKRAEGSLFFIVDSDDWLLPHAVETVLRWEKGLPPSANFCGVAGARGYTPSEIIGQGSGLPYVDCSSQERAKYHLLGDKAEVFYTEILRQFPFPVFEEERFIAESVVWFALGKAGYQIRWYDEVIYITEYLEDGLTAQSVGLLERNPKGYLLNIKSELENLNPSWPRRLGYYAAYARTAKRLGKTREQAARELGVSTNILRFAEALKSVKDRFVKAG